MSLALGQAIIESGWGQSRFATEGNALYGQWTTSEDKGIIPQDRDEDKTHAVLKFKDLANENTKYNELTSFKKTNPKRNKKKKDSK